MRVDSSAWPKYTRIVHFYFWAHKFHQPIIKSWALQCHLLPFPFSPMRLLRIPNSNGFCRKWRILAGNDSVADESTASVDEQTKENDALPKQSSGRGFGSLPSSRRKEGSGNKGSNDRGNNPIVRRAPPERPLIAPKGDPQAQQYEGVFVLLWAGLGVLILVEGILLAASGFLPEKWDKFLVKYLYPDFTPTVGLFLLGAVAYGLYKYFGDGLQKR